MVLLLRKIDEQIFDVATWSSNQWHEFATGVHSGGELAPGVIARTPEMATSTSDETVNFIFVKTDEHQDRGAWRSLNWGLATLLPPPSPVN